MLGIAVKCCVHGRDGSPGLDVPQVILLVLTPQICTGIDVGWSPVVRSKADTRWCWREEPSGENRVVQRQVSPAAHHFHTHSVLGHHEVASALVSVVIVQPAVHCK